MLDVNHELYSGNLEKETKFNNKIKMNIKGEEERNQTANKNYFQYVS